MTTELSKRGPSYNFTCAIRESGMGRGALVLTYLDDSHPDDPQTFVVHQRDVLLLKHLLTEPEEPTP